MLLYGRKLGAFWRFLAGAPLPRPRVESTICRLDSVGGPSTYLQSARGVRITGARGAVGGQTRRQKASAIAAARAVEGAGAPSPAAWASPAPSVGEEAARQGPSPPPWTGVSLGNPESETECCPCAAEVGTCEPGRGRPRKSSSKTFALEGRGAGEEGALRGIAWGPSWHFPGGGRQRRPLVPRHSAPRSLPSKNQSRGGGPPSRVRGGDM